MERRRFSPCALGTFKAKIKLILVLLELNQFEPDWRLESLVKVAALLFYFYIFGIELRVIASLRLLGIDLALGVYVLMVQLDIFSRMWC
jgi:hypothetical protein